MTTSESLTENLVELQVNDDFTEALLVLADRTKLCFCHRVGERWAKAVGPQQKPNDGGQAELILSGVQMFRLNAKHLDVQFSDGSRWEHRFPGHRETTGQM